MHNIYIGYSNKINEEDFFKSLEINSKNSNHKSDFEIFFNSEYIRPGDFECYSKSDFPDSEFNVNLLNKLFPFPIEEKLLIELSLISPKLIFYIKTNTNLLLRKHPDLIFLNHLFIEKFLYE